MTYDEILKIKDIEEILETYYNSNNFPLSIEYIIRNYYSESPFKFFEEFSTYFENNGYFDMAQGKNQLYKILLDFYNEKINKENELFSEILKYDYLSLGKISTVPSIFDKVEIDNFKSKCHDFLHDVENLKTYLPQFADTPTKYILKYIHFEPFKYDILKLKENINAKLEKNQTVILFDYNTNKVFDKSKTYTVKVGEDNEV